MVQLLCNCRLGSWQEEQLKILPGQIAMRLNYRNSGYGPLMLSILVTRTLAASVGEHPPSGTGRGKGLGRFHQDGSQDPGETAPGQLGRRPCSDSLGRHRQRGRVSLDTVGEIQAERAAGLRKVKTDRQWLGGKRMKLSGRREFSIVAGGEATVTWNTVGQTMAATLASKHQEAVQFWG